MNLIFEVEIFLGPYIPKRYLGNLRFPVVGDTNIF